MNVPHGSYSNITGKTGQTSKPETPNQKNQLQGLQWLPEAELEDPLHPQGVKTITVEAKSNVGIPASPCPESVFQLWGVDYGGKGCYKRG